MKQLKFMLAVATVISLATASQAADYQGSTNFEDDAYTIGDFNPGAGSGWVSPTENYSAIVEGGSAGATSYTKKYGNEASTHKKALYVETAAKPLLRHIETDNAGAVAKTLSSTDKVYIDTMVQFTVTPDGEEPTPGDDDKLMLYAKKDGETTKLYVVAAKVSKSLNKYTFETNHVEIQNVSLNTDTWYRLTVTAYKDESYDVALFNIMLNGNALVYTGDNKLYVNDDETFDIFPSLLQGSTITSVGFAGEGMVDDLVLTPDDPFETTPTAVDFTFTWTTAGISAVQYAIDDATKYTDLGKDKKLTDLDPDAIIKIQITPAEWYAVKEDADLEYTASEEKADLDNLVTKLTSKEDDEGNVVVNPNATVAEVQAAAGITAGAFADPNTSTADLEKVLTWKKKKGGDNCDINNIEFDVPADEETDDTKAYLLNCSKNELATELAKFKFAGFDPAAGTFKVGSDKMADDKAAYGNGYVEVRGSSTVNGAYNEAADNSKHYFFKAFLVPFAPVAE